MQKWGGKRDLTLPQQLLFMRANRNAEGEGRIVGSKLVWRFEVRPCPLSRSYFARIEYKIGKNPEVFVEDPDLSVLAGERELPHVYHDPLRLCLFMPGTGQWCAHKRIDGTIVPWTYTWLFYFEDWLAFDEWHGGGKHPSDDPERDCSRRIRRSLACN